jgi:hypothetical protein
MSKGKKVRTFERAIDLPPSPADEIAFVTRVPNNLDSVNRVHTRIGRNAKGEIVDWHIGQQVKVGTIWMDVVSYDCSHGQPVHRHRYRPRTNRSKRVGKPKVIYPAGVDLEEALDNTNMVIYEELNSTRERFLLEVSKRK